MVHGPICSPSKLTCHSITPSGVAGACASGEGSACCSEGGAATVVSGSSSCAAKRSPRTTITSEQRRQRILSFLPATRWSGIWYLAWQPSHVTFIVVPQELLRGWSTNGAHSATQVTLHHLNGDTYPFRPRAQEAMYTLCAPSPCWMPCWSPRFNPGPRLGGRLPGVEPTGKAMFGGSFHSS